MKYCHKCDMKITGNPTSCPLCAGVLSGEGNEEDRAFPLTPTVYSLYGFFFRLLIAASLIGAGLCLLINKLTSGRITWSLIVLAGIVCMWLSLLLIINKRRNIVKCMVYQVIAVSLLVIPWDYLTGWRGWSIDFVLPILSIALMVNIVVLAKLSRQRLEDHLWYLFLSGIFGIVPVVFIFMDWLQYPLPSYLCVGCSIVSLALTLSFRGADIAAEIRRRAHI